jgi:transposase
MKMTSPDFVPDFSNQVLFIGIDVHKRNWRIGLRMGGRDLKGVSIDPHAARLHQYLQRHYPGARYMSCYEAGCFGFSIHEQLLALGIENLVIHPADVPTSDKDRVYKTDSRDAQKLARELEKGLKGIYVPTPAQQQLRALWRLRFRLVGEQTRYKNRIKGFMTFSGYALPATGTHWSRAFLDGLLACDVAHEAGRLTLDTLVEALRETRARIAMLTKQLSRFTPETELLMSIPGIGRITALALQCELMDLARFKSIDQLSSFIGLIPSTQSSGDHQDSGRLTRRRNRYLRALLVEAAWVAVGKDPTMTAFYMRLKKRMKPQDAIIRVTKKLVRRIWSVWRSGQPYVCAMP